MLAVEMLGLGALPWYWWLAPAGSVLALVFAYKFYREILAADPGDEQMQKIASYVREGAFAYLKRQYYVVAIVFVVLVLLLAWQAFGLKQQHVLVPFAFLTGGFFSGLAGFFGMNTATLASSRTAQGAKESLNRGLQIAFRAGSVMGLVVVGLGLLDITAWFLLLVWLLPALGIIQPMTIEQITVVMLCFGMGASTQALFARVGGGIYTKSADVGADLVGKTEANIPEDDPRNPAVIADNVGDNVGDVAGMGADLYESYCGSILATAALGASAASVLGLATFSEQVEAAIRLVSAPMVLAGIGIALSILSIYFVKTEEGATQRNLLWALRRGVWGASGLIFVASLLVIWLVLGGLEVSSAAGKFALWPGIFGAVAVGLLAGVLIGWFTEYYTSSEYEPTKWLATQCLTGPATTIIGGVAQGMLSAWAPITIVGVGTILAYGLAGGFSYPALGLYGVGFAAVGMLATLGVTLATDAYGPIADNAGGNAQMTHQPPYVRERTDALDALGNTTAATGKGFAIGSAALTALALLAAFIEEVRVGIEREVTTFVQQHPEMALGEIRAIGFGKYAQKTERPDPETGFYPAYIQVSGGEKTEPYVLEGGKLRRATQQEITAFHDPNIPVIRPVIYLKRVKDATLGDFMEFYRINLMNPKVLVGAFFGVLMVFVFCGLTMKAVGRAASRMVEEVRRQFRELRLLEDPGARADYATCVSIATAGAQREMVLPALLAVIVPVVLGLLLDVSGLMGLLAGGLTCGFAVAVFMANAGGSWDNAKKYIEAGNYGGKGSDAHKAGVVGDTVGDPFKDTSGPSLNILIKLMSMVAVVFAGVIVKYAPRLAEWLRM
ncbi:MAG: sodium-translocating pyrophosphatase [Gemmatales bacterium]|nr:sodium-translocating pyrophosphatase [Gemmatales bacterium]MDW7995740.1 sodium-translocating pyrophosphatase [Gemmatales bacterium]